MSEELTAAEREAKLRDYEELKIAAKDIEKKLEVLKPIVVEIVGDHEKVHLSSGWLERKKRDNWTYTAETQQMAEDLKARQAEEVAKGLAANSPTYFVEYRQKKQTVAE